MGSILIVTDIVGQSQYSDHRVEHVHCSVQAAVNGCDGVGEDALLVQRVSGARGVNLQSRLSGWVSRVTHTQMRCLSVTDTNKD